MLQQSGDYRRKISSGITFIKYAVVAASLVARNTDGQVRSYTVLAWNNRSNNQMIKNSTARTSVNG